MSAPGAVHPRFCSLEEDGGLRVLRLRRPPVNVLTIEMMKEMAGVVAAVGGDAGAAALLVTGEGKAFCAGVDVADHTADRVEEMLVTFHDLLTALSGLEIPVVAAVNGAALGGGLELALACDVILARAGAKLGQPEIRLGVFPPYAVAVLPARIGMGAAMDLCLSGRTVTAEDALSLGLVQQVHPREDFEAAAREYAADLAALSPAVVRLAKRALRSTAPGVTREELRRMEEIYLNELMKLEDAEEGLAAFMEKRPPVWKGA
ncbi:MAG: enoyl-CoA hydratase/isomerase family protein [Gemmatimonadota bacterium]